MKTPLPGHCLVIVDENDERDDEWNGGPQVGKVRFVHEADADKEIAPGAKMTYRDLIDKTVYWEQYAEAHFSRFDKELGEQIAFIKLEKLVGVEYES